MGNKIDVNIGLSSCPNDTFILYPLINKDIDWGRFCFNFIIEDVEKLNIRVLNSQIDVSKMSIYAYLQSSGYKLMDAGSAIGENNGPLLIAKPSFDINSIKNSSVAIPGEHTTAHLLLDIAFPDIKNKNFMPFDQIENHIITGQSEAGVIIHETRFNYQKNNLKCFSDFGKFWQEKTGEYLPLGCFGIKDTFSQDIINELNEILSLSVAYAMQNPQKSADFVKQHAKELDIETINKHIQMFVNNFTVNMGEKGKQSINKLKEIALEHKLIKQKI